MLNIIIGILVFIEQLSCDHSYDFINWTGDIISKMTEPWSSETGLKEYRFMVIRCVRCKKVTRQKVLVGVARYGGGLKKLHEDAYE
jgi:hypothetical protein